MTSVGQGQVPTTLLSLKRVIVMPVASTEYRNGRAGRTSPYMDHARGSTAVSAGLAGATITMSGSPYSGTAQAVWASGRDPITGATRTTTAAIRSSHSRNPV